MKRRLELWSLVCAAFAVGWIAAPLAQGTAQAPPWQGRPGKANWLIDGGDPQKNAWQRNETLITKESVRNMKLAWKLQLDNQPRQMHNLFPPLIVSDVTTATGRRRSRSSRGSPTTSTASTSPGARSSGSASSTARSSNRPAGAAPACCVPAG